MNHLIEITKQTVGQETAQTMSSREIAQLCGKEHRNVMRDIRQIFTELKIELNDFSGLYKDSRSRTLLCYHLPKRECLILVSGYSTVLRAKIIDRWQELEKQVAVPQIDYSSPQVMLGVLTHLKDENERKDTLIAELTPKAMALESLQRHEGLFSLTEAAKILEIQPKPFVLFLQKKGWVYRKATGGNLLPYQDKIQKQLMDCPTITFQTASGIEKVIPCAKITTKGIGVLSQELKRQNMH
ncbi:Rha family transcriptional regulator [Bartonella sp. AR 15-3]|uniref:Rha family transcriptional regulator n=1 Tax=Bartonella sp. AR 15-3 TaxID=545617 RepID=UPI0001F4BCC5|nr:phage regulatory protein/antirepressor Ant [Bartonella sp. AR 15-3]OPB31427.1 Phage antirepressor protein YoqD, KilAC domain [Bartonella sp. AR 15-3]CBI78652.1 conserved hypothetical protein [Bartonella sp. AR 15-3]